MFTVASAARSRTAFAFAAVLAFALSTGCGGGDETPTGTGNPGAGDALVAQANAQLADILYAEMNSPDPERPSDVDVRPALALYQQALAVDPTNRQANFGVAILNLVSLTSDTEVNDAFDEWEGYLSTRTPFQARGTRRRPLGVPLFFEGGTAAMKLPFELLPMSVVAHQRVLGAPDPQLSRIQAIIRDRVIPRLTEARTRLGTAAVPGFVFWVTPRMQGDPGADSVEVDQTDLLLLKAGAGLLQAVCHTAVAYQLGMTAYDSLSLYQSMQQGSAWLSLATGGASYVSTTDDLMIGAIDDADDGVLALIAETDPQDNDVIRLGPGGGSDVQEIRDELERARDALSPGGITLVDDWDGNSGTPDVALDISLNAWFTNPVANLKSLLPDYAATVERRPFHVQPTYQPVSGTISATVPGAGTYNGYAFLWMQDRLVTIAYTSGEATLANAALNKMIADAAALESNPDWNGTFQGGLNVSGTVAGGGSQPFDLSGTYYYELATDHVFIPILHWDASTFNDWTFPDPTFHGVLPGMTSNQVFFDTFGITGSGWTPDVVLDWTEGGGGAPRARAGAPREPGALRAGGITAPHAPARAPVASRRGR